MFEVVFIDYFLAGELAILISLYAVRFSNEKKSYVLFFVFQILFGYPLFWICKKFSAIIWGNTESVFIKVVRVFCSFFAVLPEHIDYAGGYLYSAYIPQIHRLLLILFWCILLVCLSLIKEVQFNKQTRIAIIVCLLFLSIIFPNVIRPWSRFSMVQKNESEMDLIQRQLPPLNDIVYYNENAQDPRAISYDMEFYGDVALSARVTVTLDKEYKDCQFTLLESLNIRKVLDSNGNKLFFTRDGNYLYISSPNKVSQMTFYYSGRPCPFYAELGAIWLPSGIPYYPIPGIHNVYTQARSNNMVYMAQVKEENTDYHIVVHGMPKIYCSLNQIGNGEFQGVSNGFFLLSGLVEEDVIGDVRILYPSLSDFGLNEDRLSSEKAFIASIDNAMKNAGWEEGLNGRTLVVSAFLNYTELFSVYSDHVVIPWIINPDDQMAEYFNAEMEINNVAN